MEVFRALAVTVLWMLVQAKAGVRVGPDRGIRAEGLGAAWRGAFPNTVYSPHLPPSAHSGGPAGEYYFEYDSSSSAESQSFREERGSNGEVQGRFGFVGPDGTLRVASYTAGRRGFRITYKIYYPQRNENVPPIVGHLPVPAH